jgi:hypothetical protein
MQKILLICQLAIDVPECVTCYLHITICNKTEIIIDMYFSTALYISDGVYKLYMLSISVINQLTIFERKEAIQKYLFRSI